MQKKYGYSVKKEIINAFLELMLQKPYMDITVTDIVNTAHVARASFYRNFNSTSDVMDALVEELSVEFIEDIYPILISTDERKWREFLFQYFYRLKCTSQKMLLFNSPNSTILFSRMDAKMQTWNDELSTSSIAEKYNAFGKKGLISNIAKKWMEDGMKETPEEMIDYIMSFILSF